MTNSMYRNFKEASSRVKRLKVMAVLRKVWESASLKFKKAAVLISVTLLLLFAVSAYAVLSDRVPVINFQGSIADGAGLAFDGDVKVEVRLYSSTEKLPANLVYAEEFSKIRVEHGIFNVPIFSGTPLDGTSLKVDDLVKHSELYANVAINGVAFLEDLTLGSNLSAIRAERAKSAEVLTEKLQIFSDQIPIHDATKLTSGMLADSTIPQVSPSNISGQFMSSQIPNLDASTLTGAAFPSTVFDVGVQADRFTLSTLSDNLVPSEILKTGTFKVKSGTANHGTRIGLPTGSVISECKWAVSINQFNEEAGAGSGIDYLLVDASPDGVVDCKWSAVTKNPYEKRCTANYIVVCRK